MEEPRKPWKQKPRIICCRNYQPVFLPRWVHIRCCNLPPVILVAKNACNVTAHISIMRCEKNAPTQKNYTQRHRQWNLIKSCNIYNTPKENVGKNERGGKKLKKGYFWNSQKLSGLWWDLKVNCMDGIRLQLSHSFLVQKPAKVPKAKLPLQGYSIYSFLHLVNNVSSDLYVPCTVVWHPCIEKYSCLHVHTTMHTIHKRYNFCIWLIWFCLVIL